MEIIRGALDDQVEISKAVIIVIEPCRSRRDRLTRQPGPPSFPKYKYSEASRNHRGPRSRYFLGCRRDLPKFRRRQICAARLTI